MKIKILDCNQIKKLFNITFFLIFFLRVAIGVVIKKKKGLDEDEDFGL